MPDFSTTDVVSKIQPAKGMSLAEMVGLSSRVQELRQAQQMNPLALQKAQLELEQAKQVNPLLVRKAAAETESQETSAKKAKLGLSAEQANLVRSTYGGLLTDPDFNPQSPNPDGMKAKLDAAHDYLVNVNGIPESDVKMTDKMIGHVDKYGVEGAKNISQHIKNLIQQGGGNANQFAQLNQNPANLDTGGNIIQQRVSPYQQGQASTVYGKSISPQVVSNPITGALGVMGGGQGGGGGAPVGASAGGGGGGGSPADNKVTQLTQQPNESRENFNARVKSTQDAYAMAIDKFNNPQSEHGHIPSKIQTDKTILNLLKDNSVRTGAVADYMAGKTNKGSMSAKEQELVKFMEQRIQNMSPRSNMDAKSKHDAYGSYNMDKEALKELIRTELGQITHEELLSKGILHNGTNYQNPNNPNFGGVQKFTTEFSNYADPTLMKYISIVGEKQKATVDDDDKKALGRLLGSMTSEKRQELEQKRQEVLKLVNKGQ